MTTMFSHAVQPGLRPLPAIKNIVAVSSAKGGVGKSTISVNLALALLKLGYKVGILDADIYGPSLPLMLGIQQTPHSDDKKTLEPLIAHGLQLSSMGFLVNPNDAMIWRGPMVTQALQQLLTQTRWHDLDFLIIDMPPGTGDISLTLAQRIPTTGAVVVTTPQPVAVADARRGIKMLAKVGIDVVGLIENMSYHICSHCGTTENIFGSGGALALAEENNLPLLGCIPLEMNIRKQMDEGRPPLVIAPDSATSLAFIEIARKVASAISAKKRDYSSSIPPVVQG